MTDASARLLKLLSLLQSREWTGTELADHFGVSGRTVRKDIDRLRNLGYPVEATRGAIGGYRLGAGAHMPPLLLDDEEAIATAVGLRAASSLGIAGIEDAALRAMMKLEHIFPSRLRKRIEAIRTFSAKVPLDTSRHVVDAAILQALASACRTREKQRLSYQNHTGARSRRIVEPHRVVNWDQRWYLVAWDDDRQDWRTFRVDRIAKTDPTGQRFRERPLPEQDITSYIARNVSRAGWRYHARVIVHAPADTVIERIPVAYGSVEPIDDASCVLETGSDDLWSIAVYIAILDFDFNVLDPPELRDYVSSIAERCRRAAG